MERAAEVSRSIRQYQIVEFTGNQFRIVFLFGARAVR
jgi:hypothetical protein